MSELKLVSPLLDGFAMGDPISDHNGARCCPAMKENSDDKYIVKIISIPASQKQLDALLFTGAYRSTDAASAYFKELAEDTVKEARLLQQLSKLEGFLSYEDWQIVPMEGNEVGYDIYLLGSYKRSLDVYLKRNTMTHLGAVNLGIDLCTALSLCRRAGFIYTNLKPGNVFLTGQREYRIGDLGFAKLSAMKYTSINPSYISRFTPPEMHDPLATLNPTVDTYAVGMILYMIYNNGHIPFETKAPMMILPSPLHADYELAEIILKACDPNPRKRYQTPAEMGKALVSYMQRNSINDIPIVPPGAAIPTTHPVSDKKEPISETAPTAAEPAIAEDATNAQPDELEFMNDLVSDDTAPDADVHDEFIDVQMSFDVDNMLSQADDLLAHEPDLTPEPEVTEEAAEESVVPEIVTEEEADLEFSFPIEETEELRAEEAVAETISNTESEDREMDFDFDFSSLIDEKNEEDEEDEEDDEEEDQHEQLEFGLPGADPIPEIDDDFFEAAKPRRKKRGWIGVIILLLILALLGGGGYYYYDNYYLISIDNMVIDGFENSLSIELSTDADESILTVVCTDTYGNKKEQRLTDSKTVFTDLTPETMYKVTVVADGFHKLTGSVSGSYITSEVTNIVDFSAKGGIEDGSVILNFTVDGPETSQWFVQYEAEGEESKSEACNGHMVTINDLSVGKLYTFTLVPAPGTELYMSGNTTLEYLASSVVVAENPTIESCIDGVLTTRWSVPEDTAVEGWIVRCYSDSGYEETITVNETKAQFAGISTDTAYTVEITAIGMSQSARAFVTANPATVTDVQVSYTADTGMRITWNSESAPVGGWLVMYSVDGSSTTEMAECTDTTATIKNVIPNASYSFQIMAADGSTVFGGKAEHAGIEAVQFNAHALNANQIQSSLCRTPSKEAWTHEDVQDTDYTTSYALNERASLVLYTSSRFYLNNEETTVMFVIRDAEGKVLSNLTRTKTSPWRELWPGVGKYCYLDVPVMPAEFGNYTLEIYFNGATVLIKNFSIISDIG